MIIGIVEDSDEDFATYRRGLKDAHELHRWTRAEDLIKAILDDPGMLDALDLLLLDLTLPGIDGVHLAHAVRGSEGGAELPIVVLSGTLDRRGRARATAIEATDLWAQPRNRKELGAFVQRLAGLVGVRG